MLLVALLIGVVVVIAAIRNSQAALFTALATDVPGFTIWAAAIIAVGCVSYIPGLKTAGRLLLGLVIVVLLINNYQAIISGLQSGASNAESGASGSSSSSSTSTSSSTATSTPTSTLSLSSIANAGDQILSMSQ